MDVLEEDKFNHKLLCYQTNQIFLTICKVAQKPDWFENFCLKKKIKCVNIDKVFREEKTMFDIIVDTFVDSIKLLPFLFITYLIMEYIEHKMGEKSKETIKKSGKWGPFFGSLLGIFPQCGFSVSATNLYAGRVITLGTLISVYLSTSDEMLPIFISEAVSPIVILKILAIKFIIGFIAGFFIDFVIRLLNKKRNIEDVEKIHDFCDKEHCHCEHGILKSTFRHTINIFVFIIIINFIINVLIYFIGQDKISNLLLNKPVLGPIIAGIIGLIPNCAASVVITNMYLQNVISVGSLISGLLVGAGVGLALLFKTNKGIKQNINIVVLLYVIGVVAGIILELIGIKI